jgi:hypothetical protein
MVKFLDLSLVLAGTTAPAFLLRESTNASRKSVATEAPCSMGCLVQMAQSPAFRKQAGLMQTSSSTIKFGS